MFPVLESTRRLLVAGLGRYNYGTSMTRYGRMQQAVSLVALWLQWFALNQANQPLRMPHDLSGQATSNATLRAVVVLCANKTRRAGFYKQRMHA